MNVIWKRPDGFHGASPEDFKVLQLEHHPARVWLHKTNKLHFPFRISGGWQDEQATKKLNALVNLLDCQEDQAWVIHLEHLLHESNFEDRQLFWQDFWSWVLSLEPFLKGDRWEIEIMEEVMKEIQAKLTHVQSFFL